MTRYLQKRLKGTSGETGNEYPPPAPCAAARPQGRPAGRPRGRVSQGQVLAPAQQLSPGCRRCSTDRLSRDCRVNKNDVLYLLVLPNAAKMTGR